MPADILLLGDALAVKFQNLIDVAGVLNTAVTREYEVTHDMGTMVGRKVEIFPLTYNPVEAVDRESSTYDFRYSFVIIERWNAKGGQVPKAWMDERVSFVEELIFNPLDPTGKNTAQLLFVVVDGEKYYPVEVEVTSVFDFDILRKHKVFWSEVEVAFRKIGQV